MPWAALPGTRPGTFLLEQYAFAVVPHAPFVLEQLTAPPRAGGENGTLLAVSGMPADLPAEFREIETVARLAKPRPVVMLEGEKTLTADVLRELSQARWAHFDTHGFFADPDTQSVLHADPDPLGRLKRKGLASIGRNPLVLSGLVLATGNGQGARDGIQHRDAPRILTAEAIAGAPLQKLELAVLSACETGLGTVAGGEGVFGLQRAFHLAGAQSVVASLWVVQIGATHALMAEFYRNMWEKKLPKIEALRQAQLTIINKYRVADEAGGISGPLVERPQNSKGVEADRLPPRFWAGFILSGDWK